MVVSRSSRRRRPRALVVVAIIGVMVALVAPSAAFAGHFYRTDSVPYVALASGVAGEVVPLINSGEIAFGDMFEGIPDGIGAKPGPGRRGYVDLYVAHEQSHVPFRGRADFQDSSVSRVRVNVKSKSITDLEVVLSPDLGLIRLCSAFMAGPDQGFPKYTFLVNEESNDLLEVPAGAPYGSDPSVAPLRQAGYSAYVDTTTGKVGVIASAGRHNHENMVIVPGWKRGIVALSGDDTFTFPSTIERPNLSQLYLSRAHNANHFIKDNTQLWAFRVTANNAGPVDPANKFNEANDYFDMGVVDNWKGEFIRVPRDVANGTTGARPQDALEDWSNANNVFQFVRVEDIAYDPDQPRVVYFADTGNDRLVEDTGTGRLYRAGSGGSASAGRIFKMVFNEKDPTKVDSFRILTEASSIGMRNPDNIDVGRNSLMVQEDTTNAKIWRYDLDDLDDPAWTHVATATQSTAETTGIVDVSRWFGSGWWAVNVQSHVDKTLSSTVLTWSGPPGPAKGSTYQERREDGQLLLIRIAGS